MHSQNQVELFHYTKIYKEAETEIFFLYKNLSLVSIVLMNFKDIDSPDRSSSSAQSRYVTVLYY